MPPSFVEDMFFLFGLAGLVAAVAIGVWTFVEWLIARRRFRKGSTGDER
jgi:hypothetical protein